MRSTENIKRSIQKLQDKTTPQLDKRTLDDIYSAMDAQQLSQTKPSMWRKIMHSKTTKIAAGFIIIFMVLFGFNLIDSQNGTAFANAIEKLAAAQTAKFDLSIEFGEQPPQTSTFLYDANGYIKQNMANGVVNVIDYNKRKVLSLDPETMTAALRDIKNGSFHSALREIFIKFPDMIAEAMDLADNNVLSLGTATIDGRSAYGYQIETTVQKPGLYWQGKGTLTIWADAETDFPLEVQWYSEMTDMRVTVSNIRLDLTFDPEETSFIIPKGYTLENHVSKPVESANSQHGTAYNEKTFDPNLIGLLEGLDEKEQTLVKLFHSWTVLTKGKFPSSLTTDAIKDIDPDAEMSFSQELWSYSLSVDLPNIMGNILSSMFDPKTLSEEQRKEISTQINKQLRECKGLIYEEFAHKFREKNGFEYDQFGKLIEDIGAGFEVVFKMPGKSDWHYNGTGAKLGDAGTAIFWYKPKGSDSYRAIFGDLTIEDVAKEDLYLLETPSDEEIDQNANKLLETAIQLGAGIPKDKRAIVLRVLTLKEKDLIKGLATYLEFSDGTYPPTMNFDKAFAKHLDGFLAEAYKNQQIDKKQGEAKTLDISFAAFFFDKLTRQKKDPVYYGETVTVKDTDKVLVRWKISKKRYRVVYGSLKAETVTAEKLAELEK